MDTGFTSGKKEDDFACQCLLLPQWERRLKNKIPCKVCGAICCTISSISMKTFVMLETYALTIKSFPTNAMVIVTNDHWCFLYINSLIREERMWKGTSQKTHLICHHISHHLTLTYSSHYFEIICICICTHHSVSKTVDLTDAELGAYKDHSFNVGILEKIK